MLGLYVKRSEILVSDNCTQSEFSTEQMSSRTSGSRVGYRAILGHKGPAWRYPEVSSTLSPSPEDKYFLPTNFQNVPKRRYTPTEMPYSRLSPLLSGLVSHWTQQLNPGLALGCLTVGL